MKKEKRLVNGLMNRGSIERLNAAIRAHAELLATQIGILERPRTITQLIDLFM